MSYLAKAAKPKSKPPMITIVGSPGTGKTSLGAMFPNSIMMMAEDGASVFDNWDDDAKPAVMPRLPKASKDEVGNMRSTRETLMGIMDELLNTDHGFTTLVVDSITSLDMLLCHEIALRDGVNTVADASGGFHKGYTEVASWHAEFVYKCEQLRAVKKMGIVFLAHTGIKKIRNRPDSAADYSVFSMDMDNQALSIYTSQCDAVLYLVKEEFVQGAETNRKGQTTKYGRLMQTGERKLITTGDGQVGYINAKNRYNMPAEIPVEQGSNPILQYVKFYNSEVAQ
ncbi:MAG: hypothetical protein Tp138OMZ00d2C19078221_4 [Prokaryotic dsDNA virus sp.]|mgnify:CR=1 FL=1|jgi:hypothetical protein|nr:hypothetical protein [Pseudomonadales bacterium]QDP67432.1 MAG: hypothetical protein Tp138OMZ00d2C19078221_4 [Prokaryotic dsDNA virus sp.]|tara:strand:+ start:32390 stop:33238 length:849 start_codon:yes stop_codon:yes gene_type:complete